MPGTKAGGLKAAETNRMRHGARYYEEIGSLGGKVGRTGGFFADRELARRAGRLGGQHWSAKRRATHRRLMKQMWAEGRFDRKNNRRGFIPFIKRLFGIGG